MKKALSLSFLALAAAASAVTTQLTPSSDFVTAFTNAKSGDTLRLEAGTYSIEYTAGSANTITLAKTGTPSAPIVIMADGFASKQTQGAGNKFYECRAWENSDDGFDAFDSPDSIIVIDSWAFRNGVNVFGADSFAGNGNGFKLGGNSALANNRCTRCIAFGNPAKGFDQNNNTGGITVEQSIGYANGINFGMGGTLASGQKHTLYNNISYAGSSSDSYGSHNGSNNGWDLSVTVNASDFQGSDTAQATLPRNVDGSLQTIKFLHLAGGSTTALKPAQKASATGTLKLRRYNLLGRQIKEE